MNSKKETNKQDISIDLVELQQENELLKQVNRKLMNQENAKLNKYRMVSERINRFLDIIKKILIKLKIIVILRAVRELFRKLKRKIFPPQYAKCAEPAIFTQGPLVSVIIPCFNYGQFIKEAITSIENQTWKDIELLIMDDCSTDILTKKVLKELAQQGYQITYNKKNSGIVKTRNTGIEKAIGKYIVCLDADDKLEKTYIEKCVWLLETNPEVGVAYSKMKEFGLRDGNWEAGPFELKHLKEWNQVPTVAMFRKACWEEVGGYNNYMKQGHEDWEFWLSIAEKGWLGKRIDEELFLYRVHSKESLSNKALKINEDLVARIRELHSDLYFNINFENEIVRLYKKVLVDGEYVNKDKSVRNDNEKVVLLFVPFVLAGGAEKLWLSYIKELKQYGYKFLIISTINEKHVVYDELKELVIGIFNLPMFMNENDWRKFIDAQIAKYQVKQVIISNNRYMYAQLRSFKETHKDVKVFDIVYNDSKHGCMDESIKNKEYIDVHMVNNLIIKGKYIKNNVAADSIFFLPSPVDIEIYRPEIKDKKRKMDYGIKTDDVVISFLGRYSTEKNIEVFISALGRFIHEHNDYQDKLKFLIVGGGELAGAYKELIEKLNLTHNVQLIPFTNDPKKIYAITDLFLLISTIEGNPLSVLEALSMNIPVIASQAANTIGILKHKENSYVIDNPNVENCYIALESIFIKQELSLEINSREAMKEFDIRNLGQLLNSKL